MFPSVPGKQLIRKFYNEVKVVEHPLSKDLEPHWFTSDPICLDNLTPACENTPFFGITLNKRLIKSIYKDDLLISSRPLA